MDSLRDTLNWYITKAGEYDDFPSCQQIDHLRHMANVSIHIKVDSFDSSYKAYKKGYNADYTRYTSDVLEAEKGRGEHDGRQYVVS